MMTEQAYPQSPVEAVSLGLYQSITAPSEEQSQRAFETTLEIIAKTGMSEHEVEKAKALALVKVEKE